MNEQSDEIVVSDKITEVEFELDGMNAQRALAALTCPEFGGGADRVFGVI